MESSCIFGYWSGDALDPAYRGNRVGAISCQPCSALFVGVLGIGFKRNCIFLFCDLALPKLFATREMNVFDHWRPIADSDGLSEFNTVVAIC